MLNRSISIEKKYGGQQQSQAQETGTKSPTKGTPGGSKTSIAEKTPSNNNINIASASASDSSFESVSVAELETAISEQGNVVRDLKASKTDKAVIQPQIAKLLSLKAQLTARLGSSVNETTPPSKPPTGAAPTGNAPPSGNSKKSKKNKK